MAFDLHFFAIVPANNRCRQSIFFDIPSMTGRDIVDRLREEGWTLDRVHGSHHVMVKDGVAVPVTVHGKRDVGAGLLAAIQRQTGVRLK